VTVENELSSHVRERSALIVAVAQSERVRSIERLDYSVTNGPFQWGLKSSTSHVDLDFYIESYPAWRDDVRNGYFDPPL